MAETERSTILAVDDDRDVLAAVENDLRRQYADRYRVMGAGSPEAGLDVLGRLRQRGDPVSLIIADQRMPRMTGTQLLAEAARIYPQARRVLLTAYADTDAAIDAINISDVDYYILKPWDPPSERLYPIVDELLETWQAGTRRPIAGLRLLGTRWSPGAHRLREFLSRHQVPFRWLDVDSDPDAGTLLAALEQPRLPLVVLADGTMLADPAPDQLAQAIGMQPTTQTDYFDLVVVGAGPAGLAAGVYGASEGLSTAVIEADAPGGQAGTSSRIENYLGFPQGVSGAELTRRALTQVRRLGATFVAPRSVVGLARAEPYRVVRLDDGSSLSCRAVVVATGVRYRAHPAEGAERLVGRGVYYGSAASEVERLEGEHVIVVGGANSAGQAAVHLSRFARRVTLLVRADSLEQRMSSYLVDQIRAIGTISVRLRTEAIATQGDDHLESVLVRDPQAEEKLQAAAMFVFIGAHPHTDWLEGMVVRDARGFIETGPALRAAGLWSLDRDPFLLETSVPGVFAVGDVRAHSIKRVASAVGEGSVAIHFVHAYLRV
ncbi:MAG: FAD-dependent oxidoreductase [Gemmatimonadota bacterium]|jgi:thioredoxin reductase (NADPH)